MASNINIEGTPISRLPREVNPAGVDVPGVKSGSNVKVNLGLLVTHEELENLENNRKGFFSTAEKLRKAFPNPQTGWYAYVGETDTIWEVSNGVWVDSGEPIPSGQDMSGFVTRDELGDLEAELNRAIRDAKDIVIVDCYSSGQPKINEFLDTVSLWANNLSKIHLIRHSANAQGWLFLSRANVNTYIQFLIAPFIIVDNGAALNETALLLSNNVLYRSRGSGTLNWGSWKYAIRGDKNIYESLDVIEEQSKNAFDVLPFVETVSFANIEPSISTIYGNVVFVKEAVLSDVTLSMFALRYMQGGVTKYAAEWSDIPDVLESQFYSNEDNAPRKDKFFFDSTNELIYSWDGENLRNWFDEIENAGDKVLIPFATIINNVTVNAASTNAPGDVVFVSGAINSQRSSMFALRVGGTFNPTYYSNWGTASNPIPRDEYADDTFTPRADRIFLSLDSGLKYDWDGETISNWTEAVGGVWDELFKTQAKVTDLQVDSFFFETTGNIDTGIVTRNFAFKITEKTDVGGVSTLQTSAGAAYALDSTVSAGDFVRVIADAVGMRTFLKVERV